LKYHYFLIRKEAKKMQQVIEQRSEEQRKLRFKERFTNKVQLVSAKYLNRMLQLRGAPHGLKYFTDILENIYIKMRDVEKEKGVKTIGTYCVMVPQELVYAAGALPVKLCCGSYTAFNLGDDLSPRDACPLVKAVIGFQASEAMPIYENCDLMVIPTTCDCKKKIVYMLEDYKKVLALHVSTEKIDDENMEYYIQDLYLLRNKLEKLTGEKITVRRLSTAIDLVAAVQFEISRFYHFKQCSPSLIMGTHAMAIMNAYSYDRIDLWGNALRILNDELEMNLANGKFVSKEKNPRILITGAPVIFPNIKVPLLIEEMGGIVVADETCMGERGLYDPVSVVDSSMDGMMRALANRYIRPCTCPTFANNEQRIYKIKQMIKDHKVEGVIYHVLRLCLVYDYEYSIFEDILGEMGIPIIRLESDYNEEDVEQLKIRIEAFIEMIKFKR
jgi:benzoyl-CoA reductase/2-hydroxyglutaryl-CoA dehydratase subunit BcrC/BadD/HgdB